jgi:cobalt-zinc-cadmium efflux system protein
MLTDAAALGASLWAARLAARPPAGAMTFGFRRAEILSAAINGLTLAVVGAVVLVTAVDRLIHPVRVHGVTVTVVAAAGLVVNLAATTVLARANRNRLNIAGAFAHLLTDLWAFAGTLVAGVVIMVTGYSRADPIASLAIVVLMGVAAWRLLRQSGRILLEAAPEDFDLEEMRSHILELPEVVAVHDLHVWVVTSDLPAVSAHVVVADACFAAGRPPQLLDMLQECLAGHFDVEHSTFQLEPVSHLEHELAQHD